LNILTFDIEDWYMSYESSQIAHDHWPQLESRIEANLNDILAFLDTHNTHATFYIMGWVAQQNPETVKKIAQGGHEIGYHSWFHEQPITQGNEKFEQDLRNGLDLLENITAQKVRYYRAPCFSLSHHTGWIIPILLNHGITVCSSTLSGRSINLGTIPDQPCILHYKDHTMLELPLNRARILGFNYVYTGSGYFRILPLNLIKKLFTSHPYNMAYFHPRDFDPKVPKTKFLPFYRNIMSRLGNKTTIPKLSALIKQQPFITVGQAAEELLKTPENLPHVNLDVPEP